jgi:hypothetical protein
MPMDPLTSLHLRILYNNDPVIMSSIRTMGLSIARGNLNVCACVCFAKKERSG